LAIVDDIGAIGVIAVFYSDDLQPGMLVAAAALALLVSWLHRFNVTSPAPFAVAGLALWLTIYESGVHATIAGVILGLLTPARPMQTELETQEIVDVLENRPELDAGEVRATARLIRGSVSACDRLIDALHPWTSYLILPIFALANAGVPRRRPRSPTRRRCSPVSPSGSSSASCSASWRSAGWGSDSVLPDSPTAHDGPTSSASAP
jgi:NhaA family Na+:H+ antiporter